MESVDKFSLVMLSIQFQVLVLLRVWLPHALQQPKVIVACTDATGKIIFVRNSTAFHKHGTDLVCLCRY